MKDVGTDGYWHSHSCGKWDTAYGIVSECSSASETTNRKTDSLNRYLIHLTGSPRNGEDIKCWLWQVETGEAHGFSFFQHCPGTRQVGSLQAV